MTLILDIETDSTDPEKANLKYHGGLDYETGEVLMVSHDESGKIKEQIDKHNILIGFNLRDFDLPILERHGIDCKYKTVIDLYKCLAPNPGYGNSKYNWKDRLKDINPSLTLKNYKLKMIIETLGLDKEHGSKGDIDYTIFQKEEWTQEEHDEIQKYLRNDLLLPKVLFDWYVGIFKPLEKYLHPEDVKKYKHLTCTSGVLAYKFLCHQAGLKEEYPEPEEYTQAKKNAPRVEGGHHIHPKHEKVRGNIISRDFTSHYPTIIVGHQLHEPKINDAVQLNLQERIKAKSEGDKATSLALKVPLNSMYGIFNNPTFKNVYNPHVASETTRIGRELLKRYAMTLETAGFIPLYGFTDSVYVGIPKGFNADDLETITKVFTDLTRSEFKKPLDSYGLGVDKIMKFMWFIDKKDNNYLWVDRENKVGIKGGLFNKNCPKCITQTFENYITPKIIQELDVNFTEQELWEYVLNLLKQNPSLSAQEFTVKQTQDYSSDTSIQYKISEKYGPGNHSLIPNTAGIGVGISTSYCTIEDFENNNLTVDDIDTDRMVSYLRPFYSTKEDVFDLEDFS